MKSSEFITEDDNVTKGDFGARGGPKPQMQNAKKISMAQAFGSSGYNVLNDAGIKLVEKPSYWADLERDPIGEVVFQKVKQLFQKSGVELPEVDAWEVYPLDPDGGYAVVRGPQSSIENVPLKGVFVIRGLPYKNENTGERIEGDFLVDSQGASAYIRFWRKI